MGIDWEEILDVEGADMAEVYNENIPEEDSKYYGLVVENHYSGSGDTVGAYIYSIMWHFNQAVASWCCRGLTHVLEGDPDDPYHELEDKTCDELIEECIKLSQDAKHAKSALRDAQNLKDLIEKYKKPEPETLEMIKPRSKKIGRKSQSDWEAERKAQEAKREEERKFFQEFGEEDELPL